MVNKSVSKRLPLFKFNAFFLMWIITLSQDSTWSPVTRRHRHGVVNICQIKLHPSTETFPKTATDFPFAHLPSSCFCPRNPKLLWFEAASQKLWDIFTWNVVEPWIWARQVSLASVSAVGAWRQNTSCHWRDMQGWLLLGSKRGRSSLKEQSS